ncbi:MAG: dienelactone hydrolase family protein [Planctomycetota bacterium]
MGVPETVELLVGGGATKYYLASPAARRGPGVVVLHEQWGLVGFVKETCDKLSHENFFAIAPDLYHTSASYDPKVADALMKGLKASTVEQDVQAAVRYLADRPGCRARKIGLVGFGIGAQLALHLASVRDDVGACVAFYPYLAQVQPDLAALKAPVLAFFGGQDEVVSAATAEQVAAALKASSQHSAVQVYASAKHAFFNQYRKEAFDVRAAADAWARTVSFLRQHLGGRRVGGWLRKLTAH